LPDWRSYHSNRLFRGENSYLEEGKHYANSIGAEGFAEDCASAVDEAARLMALVAKKGLR